MLSTFFFFLFLTTNAFAGFYFGPGVAKSRYMNDRIKSYGTHASGHGYSFHGGYRWPEVALETFYHRLVTRTDSMQFRGDQRYLLYAKNNSYGVLGKYFLKTFHFRFGYAFHHLDLTLKPDTPGPEIEDPILWNEFGSTEKNKMGGTLFGVGIEFPLKQIAPYFVATSYQMSSSNTTFIEFEFGLHIKI